MMVIQINGDDNVAFAIESIEVVDGVNKGEQSFRIFTKGRTLPFQIDFNSPEIARQARAEFVAKWMKAKI